MSQLRAWATGRLDRLVREGSPTGPGAARNLLLHDQLWRVLDPEQVSDRTDRYQQNRRISSVRYEFDGGHTAEQTLDTSPGTRALQQISVPPVVTRHVRVVILSSEPGSPAGTQPPTDKVAISEVSVS
jgi:hypothetical protein